MGLGSGLQTVGEVTFISPKDGGERIVYVSYSWSAGGQMKDNGKLAPYHVYAFRDELTPRVIKRIDAEINRIARDTGREILFHLRDAVKDAKVFEDVCQKVASSKNDAFWHTGHRGMAARVNSALTQA